MPTTLFFAVVQLIGIGLLSLLLPHPPNFTAINAIALFSACYLGNSFLSFGVIASILFLNDLIAGFHFTMPFVYLSLGLMIVLGSRLKNTLSARSIFVLSIVNSLLFYLITNFGVWASESIYPATLEGLGLCYLAGLPFLKYQILGDLLYGFAFYQLFLASARAHKTEYFTHS